MNYDKIVLIGDDPKSLFEKYAENDSILLVYPKNVKLKSELLLKKNVKRYPIEIAKFPDIESMEIVKNFVLYLLNISEINPNDYVLVIFQKNGERYEITLDMSRLNYPLLIHSLKDRIDPRITESIIRLGMDIIKKGREGFPAGALFIVGDIPNVEDHIVYRIANPMRSIDMKRRYVRNSENFDTIREFATMDGATLVDSMGYVTACGVYIKNLEIQDSAVNEYGGRHLAALAITEKTRAVAFVISSEGVIRVYRDGKKIYELSG